MVFCSNNPRKQIQVEEKRFCVSDLIDRSGLTFLFLFNLWWGRVQGGQPGKVFLVKSCTVLLIWIN